MRIYSQLSYTFLYYPDNYSEAVVVYFSGCDNNCDGCQNPLLSTYIAPGTKSVTIDDLSILIHQFAERIKTNKLILSGGDPCYSYNLPGVNLFIQRNKDIYDICIYTGKEISFVKEHVEPGFKFIKVNKFDKQMERPSMKTDEFFQLSSPNQEIYNDRYECLTENGIFYFKNEE